MLNNYYKTNKYTFQTAIMFFFDFLNKEKEKAATPKGNLPKAPRPGALPFASLIQVTIVTKLHLDCKQLSAAEQKKIIKYATSKMEDMGSKSADSLTHYLFVSKGVQLSNNAKHGLEITAMVTILPKGKGGKKVTQAELAQMATVKNLQEQIKWAFNEAHIRSDPVTLHDDLTFSLSNANIAKIKVDF